jgi:hypothetical protein
LLGIGLTGVGLYKQAVGGEGDSSKQNQSRFVCRSELHGLTPYTLWRFNKLFGLLRLRLTTVESYGWGVRLGGGGRRQKQQAVWCDPPCCHARGCAWLRVAAAGGGGGGSATQQHSRQQHHEEVPSAQVAARHKVKVQVWTQECVTLGSVGWIPSCFSSSCILTASSCRCRCRSVINST